MSDNYHKYKKYKAKYLKIKRNYCTTGVFLIKKDKNKTFVLLFKDSTKPHYINGNYYKYVWSAPLGTIEKENTISHNANRELQEETCNTFDFNDIIEELPNIDIVSQEKHCYPNKELPKKLNIYLKLYFSLIQDFNSEIYDINRQIIENNKSMDTYSKYYLETTSSMLFDIEDIIKEANKITGNIKHIIVNNEPISDRNVRGILKAYDKHIFDKLHSYNYDLIKNKGTFLKNTQSYKYTNQKI
jgi:hypothetical protein